MEAFRQSFYSLGGTTLSEHQKNFNLFVKNLKQSNINTSELLHQLKPTNRQEIVFLVKLLKIFPQPQRLLQLLECADCITTNIVMKNFPLMPITGEEFVNKICPKISYIARMKFINQLSFRIQDTEVGEGYFNAIHLKYGLKAATCMLNSCGETYVKSIVKDYEVRLGDRRLIHLHKRYGGGLLRFYFNIIKRFDEASKLHPYLVLNDLETFHCLIEFGTPRLGKRLLKIYLNKYKEAVINNPKKYDQMLNVKNKRKIFHSVLSHNEYSHFYKNLMPKAWEDFKLEDKLLTYFLLVPYSTRGTFLFKVFRETYGFDIFTVDDFKDINILENITADDRVKFNLGDVIYLYPIDQSLTLLKNKFEVQQNVASAEKLLKTCFINKSSQGLDDVLNYFLKYTDNLNIILKVLKTVEDNGKLNELNEKNWNCINEMMKYFSSDDCQANSDLSTLKLHYTQFQLQNHQNITDNLRKYLTIVSPTFNFSFCKKDVQLERECLVTCCQLVQEVPEEKTFYNSYIQSLLTSVIDFNTKHPNKWIPYNVYDKIVRKICELIKTIGYSYTIFEVKYARIFYKDKVPEEVFDFILTFSHYLSDDFYMWLLNYKQDALIKNKEAIFKKQYIPIQFWYNISKMYYIKLHKVYKPYAISLLSNETSTKTEKNNSIIFSLFHVPQNTREEIITKYMPQKDCKINASDEATRDLLEVQRAVLTSLKYQLPNLQTIETILKFCYSDYLQYALKPLSVIIFCMPESMIEQPLAELMDRAVSVRKHTLHLYHLAGTKSMRNQVLAEYAAKEKNASLKLFILRKLFLAFLNDRNETQWELVEGNMQLIDPNARLDPYAYFNVRGLLDKFFSRFAKFVWDYMQNLPKDRMDISQMVVHLDQEKLVKTSIAEDVFKELLQTKILNQWHYIRTICNYSCKFLKSQPNKIPIFFDLITDVIKTNDIDSIRNLYEVLKTICFNLLEEVDKDKARITAENLFIHSEALPFKFRLLIISTNSYVQLETPSIKVVAATVLKDIQKMHQRYGDEILIILANFYKQFLNKVLPLINGKKSENFLELIVEIFKLNGSEATRILCQVWFPEKIVGINILKDKQEYVMEMLKKNSFIMIKPYEKTGDKVAISNVVPDSLSPEAMSDKSSNLEGSDSGSHYSD